MRAKLRENANNVARFFIRCPEHCICQRDVLAGAGLLRDRAAVLGAAIKGSPYDTVLHTSSQVGTHVNMWVCGIAVAASVIGLHSYMWYKMTEIPTR